jgi:hypothetical protein
MNSREPEETRASMLVAVDERDLAFVSHGPARRRSFAAYWQSVHDRAVRALNTGGQVLLAPIVDFAYTRACAEEGLDPRSQAGFEAYAARAFPVSELWRFGGESAEETLVKMRREQDAWATMSRCRKVLGEARSRFGPQAEMWAVDCSDRVLGALVEEAASAVTVSSTDEGWLTLVARMGDVTLGAYTVSVDLSGDRPAVLSRDRERFNTLLGAALLIAASGVLTLMVGEEGRVQVWELSNQRLMPSARGALLLEPHGDGGAESHVEFVPGGPLPQPV